jgi:hypothetical protein
VTPDYAALDRLEVSRIQGGCIDPGSLHYGTGADANYSSLPARWPSWGPVCRPVGGRDTTNRELQTVLQFFAAYRNTTMALSLICMRTPVKKSSRPSLAMPIISAIACTKDP